MNALDVITVIVVMTGMGLIFAGVAVGWNRAVYWLTDRDLANVRRRERALTVMDTWVKDKR